MPFVEDYSEIETGWRDLTEGESVEAERLIAVASAYIVEHKPSIDPNSILAKQVVIEVVRGAIETAQLSGLTGKTHTMGPFNWTDTPVNPGGGLYFTEVHGRLLGIDFAANAARKLQPRGTFGDSPCYRYPPPGGVPW